MSNDKTDLYVLVSFIVISLFMLTCLMGMYNIGRYHAYKEGFEFGLKVNSTLKEQENG